MKASVAGMRSLLVALLLCGIGSVISPLSVRAEYLRFPADAVTDVTKPPYSAKGDGISDDTKAIQAALADRRNKLIYLPNGTYLISAQLRWAKGEKRQVLQGQSRDGVTLRLKDGCEGFSDPAQPQAVLWTGTAPAQRFRNSIRNLTVDTGRGNPGAIGVQFLANNQGTIDTVRIRCGEHGPKGLDLGYTEEQGPCFITNVEIIGFDFGVYTNGAVNSITFENLMLEGQREVGFRNEGQCVFIRGLQSKGDVQVFQNNSRDSLAVLLDSTMEGTGAAREVPAVLNVKMGAMLVRGLKTSGFQSAVENLGGHEQSPEGTQVAEWISHPHISLFDSPQRTLNLPVKDTPEVPWDDPRDWISVTEFQPKKNEVLMPNGKKARIWDWTDAIQQAIDSGKSTVYFPKGGMEIAGTVRVRGKVRRLIGCEQMWGRTSNGTFIIEDGAEPVVLERFDWVYTPMTIRQEGKRPLIVKNITGGSWEITSGSGDVFLQDVCTGQLRLKPFANVWARQLNTEGNKETKTINDGGNLWILGLKTEGDATQIESTNGARTEVLGAFIYANSGRPKQPCWIVRDSSFSVTMGEAAIRRSPFKELVVETRNGETKILKNGETPARGGGSLLNLFSTFAK